MCLSGVVILFRCLIFAVDLFYGICNVCVHFVFILCVWCDSIGFILEVFKFMFVAEKWYFGRF